MYSTLDFRFIYLIYWIYSLTKTTNLIFFLKLLNKLYKTHRFYLIKKTMIFLQNTLLFV